MVQEVSSKFLVVTVNVVALNSLLFEPDEFGEEFVARDAKKASESKVCGEFSFPRCLS